MFRRYSPGFVRFACVATAVLCLIAANPGAEQAALPSARSIVDRAVKAMGGADAYKAVRSIRARGTVSIPSQKMSGTLEMFSARPNKALVRATMTGIGDLNEGFDGKTAWSMDPISGPALVTGRGLAERTIDAWFDAPLHGDDQVKQMTVVGTEVFDKRNAYRLKVVYMSGLEQSEFFDVDTGHQIGQEATRETPMGSVPTRSMSRDFKKFGKLTLPTTLETSVLGVAQIVSITTYEFNTVPAATFDLPKAIKALIK